MNPCHPLSRLIYSHHPGKYVTKSCPENLPPHPVTANGSNPKRITPPWPARQFSPDLVHVCVFTCGVCGRIYACINRPARAHALSRSGGLYVAALTILCQAPCSSQQTRVPPLLARGTLASCRPAVHPLPAPPPRAAVGCCPFTRSAQVLQTFLSAYFVVLLQSVCAGCYRLVVNLAGLNKALASILCNCCLGVSARCQCVVVFGSALLQNHVACSCNQMLWLYGLAFRPKNHGLQREVLLKNSFLARTRERSRRNKDVRAMAGGQGARGGEATQGRRQKWGRPGPGMRFDVWKGERKICVGRK
jgi:hypothetical protein